MVTKQTPRAYLVEKYGFTEDQAFDAFECMFYQWEKFRLGGYIFVRTEGPPTLEPDVDDGRIDTIGHVNHPYAIYPQLRLVK